MRYIKTYEQNINKPQVGDWVILEFSKIHKRLLEQHIDFMNSHVGQITTITYRPIAYKIDFYENIPGFQQTMWWTASGNIKMFSDDKEELEAILAADKYNI